MLTTIILIIVILGLLIFVHELGHFFTAKKVGMKVEEFGFGYPPRLFGIQRSNQHGKKWRLIYGKHNPEEYGDTVYSINVIPFGGFVKIKGEQGDKVGERGSFTSKKIWQRTVVLSAGVVMNLIFAFVLISVGFMIGLPSAVTDDISSSARVEKQFVQIAQAEEGTPAAAAGLQVGDIVDTVNGNTIDTVGTFQSIVEPALDTAVSIMVTRGDQTITTEVTPRDLDDDDAGEVGVALVEAGIVSYPWYLALWMGAKTTISITWQIIVAFYEIIKNLIVSQSVSADIAGPVGIAVLTGQVAKMGFIYILQFTALFSINLAILNYLPFPALDGGRVLFLIIEKIKGSPVNQRIEGIIHTTGFFILIGVLILITFRDVSRFSDSIGNFFSSIF